MLKDLVLRSQIVERKALSETLVPIAGTVPQRLDPATTQAEAALRQNAIPANTQRAYTADWRLFTVWCEAHVVSPLPASSETVRAFLTERVTKRWPKGRGRAAEPDHPATIERRLSAICRVHRLLGMTSPRSADGSIQELLLGIQRAGRKKTRRKAAPLLAAQIARAVLMKEWGDTAISIRDKALVLVGFSCALRRSEIVGLELNDVFFAEGMVQLRIAFSKTDQSGQGQTVVFDPAPNGLVCPVEALKAWMSLRGKAPGPLFTRIDKGGRITVRPLHSSYVSIVVKRIAGLLGEDKTKYSAHSLRAGFATQAALAGVQEWAIREQTRHKSHQVLDEYIRPIMKARRGVTGVLFEKDNR